MSVRNTSSSVYCGNIDAQKWSLVSINNNKAKLTDLTSVKQTRDESVSDYFKRFKKVKNRCFNLSISDKDLVDVALNGLRSYLKEKLEGFDYYNLNALQLRAMN